MNYVKISGLKSIASKKVKDEIARLLKSGVPVSEIQWSMDSLPDSKTLIEIGREFYRVKNKIANDL